MPRYEENCYEDSQWARLRTMLRVYTFGQKVAVNRVEQQVSLNRCSLSYAAKIETAEYATPGRRTEQFPISETDRVASTHHDPVDVRGSCHCVIRGPTCP